MPSTINGIGTTYYGKKNIRRFRGTCPHCHRQTTLTSFDTTTYFVFFFIPIIPLGKKRILNMCPACTKHSRVPLAKWLQAKKQDIDQAQSKYQRNPKDPQAAQKLIGALVSYEEIESFLELAPQIAQNQADHLETLVLLGDLYCEMGKLAEADDAYCAALRIKDASDIYEKLALVIIRQNQPDQAVPYLQHVIEQKDPNKLGLLFAHAQGYQAVGEHQKALDLLDQMSQILPDLNNDKEFNKAQKLSEENLHTNKPIKSTNLTQAVVTSETGSDISGKTAKIISIAILIIAVSSYLIVSFLQGNSREIHLINGLSRPYQININDKPHTLDPLGATTIKIAEGNLAVSVLDQNLDIPDQIIKVKIPFLRRPFLNKTFVINPDLVAPLVWEKAYYSEFPDFAPDTEGKIYYGQSLYVFDDIDHLFVPFPGTIEVSGSKTVSRERIYLLHELNLSQIDTVLLLSQEIGHDAAYDYVKKHLRYEPGSNEYLDALLILSEPDEYLEAIRPGLSARPVRIEWHRRYQNFMDVHQPDYDLVLEYRNLLQTDPKNPALLYLFGRIIRNPEQAREYFQKAANAPQPTPYAYNAMAYQYLSTAEFDKALSMIQEAIVLDSNDANFCALHRQALEANGAYRDALIELRKQYISAPEDLSGAAEEIRLLLCAENLSAACRQMNNWISRASAMLDPFDYQIYSYQLKAELAYYSGNTTEYKQHLSNSTIPIERFKLALTCNTPLEPNLPDQIEAPDAGLYLLLYLAQHRAGNFDGANQSLERALELLRQSSWEERYFANCLSGQEAFAPESLCRHSLPIGQKAILMTVFGTKFPQYQNTFFDLARRLNFQHYFPHLFLKSILGE